MADDLNVEVLETLKRSAEGKVHVSTLMKSLWLLALPNQPTPLMEHVIASDDSHDRGATLKSKLMKNILGMSSASCLFPDHVF